MNFSRVDDLGLTACRLQFETCDSKAVKIAIIVRVGPSDSPKDQQQPGSGGPQSPKKQSDSPPASQASTAPKQVTNDNEDCISILEARDNCRIQSPSSDLMV